MEKLTPITLTTETGRKYILDFDRESVLFAEDSGFVIDDVDKYPMSSTYKFIYFALRKNHPDLSYEWTKDFVDKSFGGVKNVPNALLERLGQLYAATFTSLGDKNSKNAKVTVEM